MWECAMTEKATQDEKAIIEKILQRRDLKQPRISADRMKVFKAKIGEEIQRSGKLSQEYVNELMEHLKNGEL
jgi:hypothetical protein